MCSRSRSHNNHKTIPPISHIVQASNLRIGDHIYCRLKGIKALIGYKHAIITEVNTSHSINGIKIIEMTNKYGIRINTLSQFLNGFECRLVYYGTPKIYETLHAAGTCHTEKASPMNEILERITFVAPYNDDYSKSALTHLFDHNDSEQFAVWIKTGYYKGIKVYHLRQQSVYKQHQQKRQNEAQSDEKYQKKANYDDEKNIFYAMRQFENNQNMETFSSVLAQMLEKKSILSVCDRENVSTLFNNDMLRENNKILEAMLNTKELIKYIDTQKIKQSVTLSMRYWDLLKQSKSVITLKKNQIDSLLSTCNEWMKIIQKQRKNEKLSDEEIGFMDFVCDDFKQWFNEEDNLKNIQKEWNKMYKKLSFERAFWTKKRTEINAILRRKRDNLSKAAKKKLNECSSWMGSLLVGVGTALQIASFVFNIVGKFGIGPRDSVVSVMKNVGDEMNRFGAKMKENENKNKKEAEDLMLKAHESDKMMNKMDRIQQSFCAMAKNAGKMDQLFDDFVTNMNNPHKKGSVVVDNVKKKGQNVNLKILQFNVKSIIKSFGILQVTSNEILCAINNAQIRFNST